MRDAEPISASHHEQVPYMLELDGDKVLRAARSTLEPRVSLLYYIELFAMLTGI